MHEVLVIPGFRYGILSPATVRADVLTPLVLLNSGLIHRVRPFRAYVGIGRYLAGRGVDVFRFDLPRIGDGPAAGVPVGAGHGALSEPGTSMYTGRRPRSMKPRASQPEKRGVAIAASTDTAPCPAA